MEFIPSFVNHYVCVYNDGIAAGVDKHGKPFRPEKPDDIKFWRNKDKAIKFCEKHPELGVYVIKSLIARVVELETMQQ